MFLNSAKSRYIFNMLIYIGFRPSTRLKTLRFPDVIMKLCKNNAMDA